MKTLLFTVLLAAPAAAGVEVEWSAGQFWLQGRGLDARAQLRADAAGAEVPVWMLTAAAFTVDGQVLGERAGGLLQLAPGQKLTLELDLGPALTAAGIAPRATFQLSYENQKAIEVTMMAPADAKLDFMQMDAGDLARYQAVLETNRGTLVAEFWPDVAPGHVRNFLDLCHTGFYDNLTFHRVIPGFMIQGGDPKGTGTGNGPRMLKAEFSKQKHERGVLSMARSGDPNSASSQFFVMHASYPSLDGQYSAFGKLVSGLEALDKIVNTPRDANDKPREPQRILKATVVLAGAK